MFKLHVNQSLQVIGQRLISALMSHCTTVSVLRTICGLSSILIAELNVFKPAIVYNRLREVQILILTAIIIQNLFHYHSLKKVQSSCFLCISKKRAYMQEGLLIGKLALNQWDIDMKTHLLLSLQMTTAERTMLHFT